MRILVFQLSISYRDFFSFEPYEFNSCDLDKTHRFLIVVLSNKQVNVMLESKSVTNTKNLKKEDDFSPSLGEELITADTFNIKTLELDTIENESTSYILGYN